MVVFVVNYENELKSSNTDSLFLFLKLGKEKSGNRNGK